MDGELSFEGGGDDARPDGANGISSGGGIFIDYQATLSLINVVVISNHADSGGGINNYDGWLSVSGGAILSNSTNYEGGGIGSGGYYYAYSGGGGSAPSKEKEKSGPIISRRIPAPADAGRDSAARGPITATVPDRLTAPARPAPARILAFAYDTIILSATTVAGMFGM